MNASAMEPLEGELEIPGVAPPRTQRSDTRRLVAVAVLLLSILAVLGFAVTRYFAKPAVPDKAVASPDVASADIPVLKMPAAKPYHSPPPSVPPSSPAPASSVVPSIALLPDEAQALSLRGAGTPPSVSASPGSSAGGVTAVPVSPDDAPLFPAGPAADVRAAATLTPRNTGNRAADASASLDAYQRQLAGLLENLQSLTAGQSTGAVPSVSQPAAQSRTPAAPSTGAGTALFGAMERSATPTVQARLLGDRHLVVPKGTLFLCGLKTRVVSATSGFIGCQVTRNVLSDSGRVLLIERGSHLDGEYRIVTVRPGVTRIPVLWTRVRTPHGVTIDLESPATGELGEAGLGGHVDYRWGERLGAALLLSLVNDALKYAIASQNDRGNGDTVLLPNTTDQGSKLAEKVLETTINIPPLLYQNQGGVVGVYVARDLDFSSVYELKPQ